MFYFGFNKLKFFNLFAEYFIAVCLIYVLVVLVLITCNIYGLIVQRIGCEVMAFILFLSCFFILQEQILTPSYGVGLFQLQFNGFNKFVSTTPLVNYSKLVVCFFSIIYLLIISRVLLDYKISSFEYLILLMFAILGLLLLCCTNDFLSTFLAIELISLCSYLLAGFKKVSIFSLEAGIKYLIVGAISSSFFLYGSSLVYAYSGSIAFTDIHFLLTDFKKLLMVHSYPHFFTIKINLFCHENFFIEVGVIFILFSVYVKLALAPFHLWSLDVYEGSPVISTFFFSTITKLSFFVFLYRFCFLTVSYNFNTTWFFFNVVIGFLSVLFGSFGGLRQKKLKTLLAYSSVSHMGYALLSFSTFSKLGFEMLFFYVVTYVLASIVVWYIILSLKKIKPSYKNKFSKDLGDLILLNKTNWFLALSLTLAFFSLAGIPPLLGFVAKFNVFLTLVLEQFYAVALLTILCSVISTFYYLRVIKILYFENLTVGKLYHFNGENILILSFLVFLLVFLFAKPTLLYLTIHKMVLFESFF